MAADFPEGHSRRYWRRHPEKLAKAQTAKVAGDDYHPAPAKSIWTRLLDFAEHPLFWGPVGIIGGLVGLLLYTPTLIVCGVCVLLAFHRANVVADQPPKIQILSYLVLFLIISGCLFGVRQLIVSHGPDIPNEIATKVAAALRSDTGKPQMVREPKEPLEIVDFNSNNQISIANNGPLAVYVIGLLLNVKQPAGSVSYGLGFDIEPGKIYDYRHPQGFRHVRSIGRLANTWKEHVAKAQALYGECGLQYTFFSPATPSFDQIKDWHSQAKHDLIYDGVHAVLSYRVRGLPETRTEIVPVIVTTTINADTCPPS